MESLNSGEITPFHTFDPMQGLDAGELADMLDSARKDEGDGFLTLTATHPLVAKKLEDEGIDLSNGRTGIEWDDATILFISLRATAPDGSPAEPLDRGVSMERLGRFPTNDGNAIAYLRANLIPESEDNLGSQLLTQLDTGLRKETRGHDNLSIGFGGMSLHGWLTVEDVSQLRSHLQKSAWKVSKNEGFDGGVRDVVRHLIIILKTAEKRGVGILMRSHD
ncbi:MAG TPA: hypothetical protein QF716_01880 [Candidatus Thalassarchaeaceae archaeon]|nr:hypothetical protein [Candidatus Thalassarchaeaceae archaeon]HJM67611.1 hypothetical protein [Candidatus Thalassarchaeaceae archaeon]